MTRAQSAAIVGREVPILFGAPMIRAILAGTKTQTRRILKPQPDYRGSAGCETDPDGWGWEDDMGQHVPVSAARVRWRAGDRLWVRETVRAEERSDGCDGVRYLADDVWHPVEPTTEAADRWVDLNHYRGKRGVPVNSIHMPRWASRIALEVIGVRVERLQSISEADAVAEGAPCGGFDDEGRFYEGNGTYRTGFAGLWDHINGSGSWEANPWVAVVEFRRVTP
jgi:hypothetical protein